jgi:hypothetical protein
MLALLAAMWGGLLRLGWPWPGLATSLPIAHGPVMVSGFLGTLIALERAVALNRRWMYVGPLFSGVGSVLLVLGLPGMPGPGLLTLSSLGLAAVFAVIVRRQAALYTVTMGLGALAWLAGNVLWLAGWPIFRVVMWWAGFLVLTIAGERLELARILRPSRASLAAFLAATALFLAGLMVGTIAFDLGRRLAGAGVLALAGWLLLQDVARRTIRTAELTRFIAACLLPGYLWLGAGGVLALIFGGVAAGPHYDAMLHAVFLGFVLSMIFGHAPIILPALLGVPPAYHPAFYAHLTLLHLTLLVRVIGDLGGWLAGRQWGGLLNVIVVLLFLGNTARVLRKVGKD